MKLAYLTSRYPATSHTFITREVIGLRERGADVHTFSIRRATSEQLHTETDGIENDGTFAVLPISPWRLATAHLKVLLAHPLRYLSAAWSALTDRPPGLWASVWHAFYFAEAGALACELDRRGITHLHVHFANVASEVGMLAARILGIRWSLTLHGLSDFGDPVRSRLSSKVSDAAFAVCVSDYGRAQAMLHCPPQHWRKIHVIRCGVDPDRFKPRPRRPTKQNASPLRLITVARLSPEKGLTFLLEAIDELTSANINVTWTVIGEGPERQRLAEYAQGLGMDDRVTLIGSVGHDELCRYYQEADIFVLPSLAEGLPVVLMEAMACGLPVVASRIMGIPELVDDGVSGWLVSPGRSDELVAAIKRLAHDEELRHQMGSRGRQRIIDDFDAEKSNQDMFELFQRESEFRTALQTTAGTRVERQTVRV